MAADLKRRGFAEIQIRVNAFATLNGRPSQRLIDPEKNLADPDVTRYFFALKC